MADLENLGLEKDQSPDDGAGGDSLAPWQQFLRRWQTPIAFGPFALSIFVMLKFFPDSPANWLFLTVIFTTVFWAVAVAGYALYLKYVD